jgi:hypothetical protein
MSEQVTEWCRQVFRTLAEGGTWAIPRSALIWKKQGNALVLIGKMQYHRDLPMTEAEWIEHQQSDYDATKEEFEKAGFEVRDETVKSGPAA